MADISSILGSIADRQQRLAEAADLEADARRIVNRAGMTPAERTAAHADAAELRRQASKLRGTN